MVHWSWGSRDSQMDRPTWISHNKKEMADQCVSAWIGGKKITTLSLAHMHLEANDTAQIPIASSIIRLWYVCLDAGFRHRGESGRYEKEIVDA